MNISWVEWLGYAASILVAISLLMSSLVKLRLYNVVGSILFSMYGFFIGAYPVGIINAFIILINIYYLYKMFSQKEYFKLMDMSSSNEYLKYFLDFYKEDIEKYFPKCDLSDPSSCKNYSIYYILRNTVPAGVFAGYRWKDDYFMITLDFVTPEYRDFKTGNFVFIDKANYFSSLGYKNFCTAIPSSEKHLKYLKKMGFAEENISGEAYLVKKI